MTIVAGSHARPLAGGPLRPAAGSPATGRLAGARPTYSRSSTSSPANVSRDASSSGVSVMAT